MELVNEAILKCYLTKSNITTNVEQIIVCNTHPLQL